MRAHAVNAAHSSSRTIPPNTPRSTTYRSNALGRDAEAFRNANKHRSAPRTPPWRNIRGGGSRRRGTPDAARPPALELRSNSVDLVSGLRMRVAGLQRSGPRSYPAPRPSPRRALPRARSRRPAVLRAADDQSPALTPPPCLGPRADAPPARPTFARATRCSCSWAVRSARGCSGGTARERSPGPATLRQAAEAGPQAVEGAVATPASQARSSGRSPQGSQPKPLADARQVGTVGAPVRWVGAVGALVRWAGAGERGARPPPAGANDSPAPARGASPLVCCRPAQRSARRSSPCFATRGPAAAPGMGENAAARAKTC